MQLGVSYRNIHGMYVSFSLVFLTYNMKLHKCIFKRTQSKVDIQPRKFYLSRIKGLLRGLSISVCIGASFESQLRKLNYLARADPSGVLSARGSTRKEGKKERDDVHLKIISELCLHTFLLSYGSPPSLPNSAFWYL